MAVVCAGDRVHHRPPVYVYLLVPGCFSSVSSKKQHQQQNSYHHHHHGGMKEYDATTVCKSTVVVWLWRWWCGHDIRMVWLSWWWSCTYVIIPPVLFSVVPDICCRRCCCRCCFVFDCAYLCLRVLVCSVIVEARRSVTRAGCRPPAPTRLCYYWRPGRSGFNLHLAAFCSWVERWDDSGESCAVLMCCAVMLLPFVLLVYASTRGHQRRCFIARKCPRILRTIIKYVFGKKSAQVLILGKDRPIPGITLVVTSQVKPCRVYVVWVIIWTQSTYITKFLHVVKLRANPEYSTRQMLINTRSISYFWPDWILM